MKFILLFGRPVNIIGYRLFQYVDDTLVENAWYSNASKQQGFQPCHAFDMEMCVSVDMESNEVKVATNWGAMATTLKRMFSVWLYLMLLPPYPA